MTDDEEPGKVFDILDAVYQAQQARLTSGLSLAVLQDDLFSWMNHLRSAPGKITKLATYPIWNGGKLIRAFFSDEKLVNDQRFASDGWRIPPWKYYALTYQAYEDWWREATTGVSGLDEKVEHAVTFQMRQILDAMSPALIPLMNPDVVKETIRTGGMNWVKGLHNATEDLRKQFNGKKKAAMQGFEVGKNLATTPGKVILRNHLIELIQYEPTTTEVCKEPVLIVPAWIMKYYILDLSQNNSLVKWLTDQGHTVFIISWHNPTAEDRDTGLDDYFRLGAMSALDAVAAIVPNVKIHLAGYCLGGTLAIITAAYMAAKNDDRLASLTLLAAQEDFSEPGEINLFLREGQVEFLDRMMWSQGYLDAGQMLGAFKMLRPYDLLWSKVVNEYLLGQRTKMMDLMAWNADATRMPYKMHSEYLHKLFLQNDFVEGRLTIEGTPVIPESIKAPIFAVGTEKDHVVPWLSAYKIHLFVRSSVTFVLTNGGHNAGIVSEPGHRGRYFRIHERKPGDPYLDPSNWLTRSELHQCKSWWSAWQQWIESYSSPEKVSPPSAMGSADGTYTPICDAPGTYVFEK